MKSKIRTIQNYKIIDGAWYQDRAVEDILSLLKYLKKHHEVKFILTPYHPLIWSNNNLPLVKAMKIVEKKTLEIAKESNIDVLGSFDPYNLDCDENDFYDEMHSKPSCMIKIGDYLVKN